MVVKMNYKNLTDEELIEAVELMIAKDDLKIREVAEALLGIFGYSEEEVKDQLVSGEYLSYAEPLNLVCVTRNRAVA